MVKKRMEAVMLLTAQINWTLDPQREHSKFKMQFPAGKSNFKFAVTEMET